MPATRPSSGARIPLHFFSTLTSVDFPGPKTLGRIAAGFATHLIVVQVTSPFNGGTQITIGDDIAEGNLVVQTDVYMDQIGTYSIENGYPYVATTDVRIFMSGTPTTGSANVFVFYQ